MEKYFDQILLFLAYYLGIGLLFLLVLEILFIYLKKNVKTRERVLSIGFSSSKKMKIIFLWLPILIKHYYNTQMKEDSKPKIREGSFFKERLEEMSKDRGKSKKEANPVKSKFQTMLEKAAKEKNG